MSPTVTLSCRITFCASHRLHNDALNDEENRRLFGKCNHVNGHGHNYVLYVMLRSTLDAKSHMVMNTEEIERIVEKHVLSKIDHKYMNVDVPEFKELVPTVENIVVVIWQWLKPALGDKLYQLRLDETEYCSAIYEGK